MAHSRLRDGGALQVDVPTHEEEVERAQHAMRHEARDQQQRCVVGAVEVPAAEDEAHQRYGLHGQIASGASGLVRDLDDADGVSILDEAVLLERRESVGSSDSELWLGRGFDL